MTLIKGRLIDGQVVWYTGKGGRDWISLDKREALAYKERAAAAKFCVRHNAMYKHHGVLFSTYDETPETTLQSN